ncbi:uncharacterized protein DC041_0012318 [Schistosoma bovis]|uniref:Trematode PH-like domain-containing protein n=1 Tax=Schistosoma bovis TaxID=6184 RepID=A0A430Q342_SCHBO|nr:uncharacterized protein DC041_0012318 [Schistosoma bovis]
MTSSSSPMHNNCNSSFNGSGSINGTLCRTGSLGFIDEVLRYSGTKQYIFLQVHVCTIHQVTLGDISDFHETDALSYIERYYKKRRAHCTAALLEDRICLRRVKQSGKMPFHPWVVYNEIKYIFISQKRPEYFVLCIDSNHDRRKYYEIYKCKSADDVKQIEEKMKAAMRDPDKLLRKMHILSRIMKDLTLESLNENYVVSSISITPIEFFHHSPESLIYQIKQSVYEPSQNTHSLPHSISSESGDIHVETRINDIIDKITFINHDPLKGFCESQDGNFYMFLDRQEFHLNKYIDREESFIISNQKE